MVPISQFFSVLVRPALYTPMILIACQERPPLTGFFIGMSVSTMWGLMFLANGQVMSGIQMAIFLAGSVGPLGLAVGAGVRWKWRKFLDKKRNPLRTFSLPTRPYTWREITLRECGPSSLY
jgi:hypothetical protein